jgi:hypothetical protein
MCLLDKIFLTASFIQRAQSFVALSARGRPGDCARQPPEFPCVTGAAPRRGAYERGSGRYGVTQATFPASGRGKRAVGLAMFRSVRPPSFRQEAAPGESRHELGAAPPRYCRSASGTSSRAKREAARISNNRPPKVLLPRRCAWDGTRQPQRSTAQRSGQRERGRLLMRRKDQPPSS